MGWVVNATLRPLYSREGGSEPIAEEAGWAPGPVWTGVERRKFLAPTRVRTPNRPFRSELLSSPLLTPVVNQRESLIVMA